MLVRGGLAIISGWAAFWVLTTWPPGGGTWFIGGVFALVALGLGVWTFSSSAEARCPGCTLRIRGLSSGDNQPLLCRSCVEFVEGKAGELWLVAPDRVADSPRFAAPCPEEAAWPEICAVCGAEATRMVSASWSEKQDAPFAADLATRAATLGTMKLVTRVTHSVEVPHCAQHDNGARLRETFEGGGNVVVFRSHAYLRAFCAANKVTPVP